jgi:acetyl-CoA acetyltransferase
MLDHPLAGPRPTGTLSVTQAASATGIPVVTVYRACASGWLGATPGALRGVWWIHVGDLAAWISGGAEWWDEFGECPPKCPTNTRR